MHAQTRENWILVSSEKSQDIYYDSASVIKSRSGNTIRAWVKFDYKLPKTAQGYDEEVKYSVVLFKFNCAERKFMYEKTYLYFVDNTNESYEHFPTWKYVEAGTISEKMIDILCD